MAGKRGSHFSDRTLPELARTGLTATGLYGPFAHGLLSAGASYFRPAGEGEIYGQTAFRYDFLIPSKDGGWVLRHDERTGLAGHQGSLWVDEKSHVVRRIDVEPDKMPAGIGLKQIRMVIDYELSTISGREMLLPSIARIRAVDSSGRENLSHIFFTHCRLFGSESTVSFGAAQEASGARESQPRLAALPAGLEVRTEWKTAIDATMVSAGQTLEATVPALTMSKGKEIIPPGALLDGHVRQVRLLGTEYAMTVEFDRIQSVDGWVPFYARMKDLRASSRTGTKERIRFDLSPDAREGHDLADPEIPGVETIYLPADAPRIPAGTAMKWKTGSLSHPHEKAQEKPQQQRMKTLPSLGPGMVQP